MKAQRLVFFFVALLTLTAISACFLYWPQQLEARKAEAKPPALSDRSSVTNHPPGHGKNRVKSGQSEQLQERKAATMARLNESLQTESLDKTMHSYFLHRMPHYESLFKSWDIDPLTSDQVIDVIRKREIDKRTLPKELVSKMTTSEYQENLSYKSKTLNDYKADMIGVELTAESHLIKLLGTTRFQELADMESALHENAVSEARRILGTKR